MAVVPGRGKPVGNHRDGCDVDLSELSRETAMLVPHNSFVLVTDGKKMLFFRNAGDAQFPDLAVERKREQDVPPDRALKSDAPGTSSVSVGSVRSTMEETDYHQLEEERFAAETADLLKRRALANDFDSLIVVAPSRTLGALRKHYHKEVEKRLTREIPKDLTRHPVEEIEKILSAE